MIKTIFTYIVNIAMLWILYLGLWENLEWAQNILLFYIWFEFIIYTGVVFIVILFSKELSERLRHQKPFIPIVLSTIINTVIIVGLVAFGWFGTASAFTFSTIVHYSVFQDGEIKEKNNDMQKSIRKKRSRNRG